MRRWKEIKQMWSRVESVRIGKYSHVPLNDTLASDRSYIGWVHKNSKRAKNVLFAGSITASFKLQ